MAWENLALGVYRVPRDGGDNDTDDVDYTVASPIAVGQSGNAEFLLHINWPTGLDDVQVTILLPSSASPGTASISPTQTNQDITIQSDRVIFTHDSAAKDATITYSVEVQADSADSTAITYKLEAEELAGPVTRQAAVDFSSS